MSGGTPTVSVVMAAYNGAAYIRAAIDSLFAQTVSDFEIVVADDGSTDDTLAVLAAIDDPRLHVIRAERNGGPAVARTRAMAHTRGRFIAGLDQDDLCRPDRLQKQIAYLEAHPDVALVASTIAPFGPGAAQGDPHPDLVEPDRIDWLMLMLNPLAWSTTLMRGEAARALDPFERDSHRFAEDFDLYHRIRAHGRIGRIAEPLVRYRLHGENASTAFEQKMTASAARTLIDIYRPLFGEEAEAATMLISRHVGASHPPPDSDTLARCGTIMETLLAAHGAVAPGYAAESASRLWWRMAYAGLRAGHYGIGGVIGTRPGFARPADGARPRVVGDATIGAARRFRRR